MNYSFGPGGEHMMTVAGEGRSPGREHFVKLAMQFQIGRDEIDEIMATTNSAVSGWTALAGEAGCMEKKGAGDRREIYDAIAKAGPNPGNTFGSHCIHRPAKRQKV